MKNEKVFIVTDGCMWEQNKKNSTSHAHAIEVVDIETGEVRYIKNGSRISFIEGEITDIRSQVEYNKEVETKVSSNGEELLQRNGSKGKSKKNDARTAKAKGI